MKDVKNNGKGVITTREFIKDEFICEYPGERISYQDALQREKEYIRTIRISGLLYVLLQAQRSNQVVRACIEYGHDATLSDTILLH